MKAKILILLLLSSFLSLAACSQSKPIQIVEPLNCSGLSATSLEHYDRVSAGFLDDDTRHPSGNPWGNVVWGTRYYMESLLTAYEATKNPKYIQAFMDTGTWVMNLAQTITVLDAPDPSAPGRTGNGPLLTVTGWPTFLGSFGVPVAIPTQTGQVALYAQDLGEAIYLRVSQQANGSRELAWVGSDQDLEAHTVHSLADLQTLASEPLIWGQTPGRIKPTGLGLPAPGQYRVSVPAVQTIWHGQQTAGILLPFVRFLLLAKEHPGLADTDTVAAWESKVLSIAASYEDQFASDGNGGFTIHNPSWLPDSLADTDAAADYVMAEATLRLLLYELTHDSHEFSIAKSLVIHQRIFHWSVNPEGWLLLKFWPCLRPWSSRAGAPAGSVWDSFEFDPSTPETPTDGGFFVDLLHFAKVYGLSSDLGITDDIYAAHRQAFQQYFRTDLVFPVFGPTGLLRSSYPSFNSKASDPIDPSDDPFAGSGFLTPEVADQSFVNANWNWMLDFGQVPQFGPKGYFLRAWARSEAAQLSVCHSQSNVTQ